MQNTNQNWTPYMQSMRVPEPMYPVMDMTDQQIEEMYPRIYFIIFPVVSYHCDMLDAEHGEMYIPSNEHYKDIVDNIHERVSKDIEDNKLQGIDVKQWTRGGLLRDLASIIFLRELAQRRRYPRRRRYPYDGYGRGPGYGYGPGYWY
ncbi:hypothetical protein GC105_12965 [Alkalibaculum sp. M08DMB]|uniref:Uncharacterized protein n=1 Tax=Alkalibaculum sporogenes TaxID=2655001 RepID=A0A6A7KBQ1_9FIRM|nr:hypothetical protein [Alkalibaculum sporogenes]MPW26701.1 hypothetical protein [Alkalibaculum sporogenes]